MPNDRDELRDRLQRRADADFESMTDAELRAYIEDVSRNLVANSRPAAAYDPRDPECVARVRTGQEAFKRMIREKKEAARRAETGFILEK